FALPDYAIEDQLIKINPSIVTVAEQNFNAKVKILNLGKAVGDSIRVTVKRQLANDSVKVIYNQLIPGITFADSLDLIIPINGGTDKGLNKLIFTVDADNKVAESAETNNTYTKEIFI